MLTMSVPDEQNWYYASKSGERVGPVSIRDLGSLAGKGSLGPKDMVWSPDYPDWIPAEKISDLLSDAVETSPAVSNPTVVPETSTATAADQELKPRKGSFVVPRIFIGLLIAAVIGTAAGGFLLLMEMSPWPGLAVFFGGAVLGVFSGLVAYRKERYQIGNARLLCHRGGLVSDQTTELELRNITHVKLKLPWLRYKLFGVGNVIVESAGNSRPVVMFAIREPEAVYAGIRERMRNHGYDLTQRQLLHEERPALIGVAGECLGLLAGALMAGLFALPVFVGLREETRSSAVDLTLQALAGLIVFGLIAGVVVRFLDFRRRTYRVYNDVVVYEEGFLTREHAFIPHENIADANTKCSFLDRILGLYDVQVSCQGSGSEIKFRRLKNGVELSAAIDQLVDHARRKPKPSRPAPAAGIRSRRTEPEAVPADDILVADFGMNPTRTLVPLLLLLPLFPLWILAMIQAGVRLMSTRYAVRPGAVRHSFRFFNFHEREFAYNKITGVVVKQNLWDRLFGTMTVRFWSLGSGQPLEFAHVHANQLDLPALMRQAGIPASSLEPYEAPASFGVLTWLRARLKFLPLLLFFVAAIIVAAVRIDPVLYSLLLVPVFVVTGACLHAKLYYSRQCLSFHDHHIEARQGIIATSCYYARYSNVKKVRVTRYPGGGEGDLEIFVAGEEELRQLNQRNQGESKILKPCSFTSGFLPGVQDHGLLLDDILCGRVDPAPQAVAAEPLELLLEAPRAVGNAIAKLVLFSIVLVPLIALLPVTVPLMVLRVKRWRYRVETARIVISWGIFYRSETSILLDRVDSLQQSQGPLNKMFNNGSVTIMTAGSSKPDLALVDSPAYLELYRIIREQSQ